MRINCIKRGLLVEALIFYLLPMVQLVLHNPLTRAGYMAILLPLIVFPICCFITGLVAGILSGFTWQLGMLTSAIFIPAALAFYGEVALPYSLIYGVVCYMGLTIAYPVWYMKHIRRI